MSRTIFLSSLLFYSIQTFETNGGSARKISTSTTLISKGLRNLGNTCYMNAQLECAFHVPYIRKILRKENDNAGAYSLWKLFHDMELNADEEGIASSNGIASSPEELCKNFDIPVRQQQDSQEFWKLLLPALNVRKLTDLYRGSYEDYIVAADGTNREKRGEEPFLDLSLGITNRNSIGESLADTFGTPELLSDEEGNGWRPEKGADKVDALKGQLLRARGLPSLLQLHLKRFSYNWETDSMSKINKRFTFPLKLDLKDICTTSDTKKEQQSTIYDLQSVLVHSGDYGSGHYYTYVRPNILGNAWYCFDDNRVMKVSFDDVTRDSYGQQQQQCNNNNNNGLFKRLLFGGSNAGRSYGGPKSSAYMLQYVKRSDIDKLYYS